MRYMLCLAADLFFNSQECVQEDFAGLLKIFELHFYISKFCFLCFQNMNSLEKKYRANICYLKCSSFSEKYCYCNPVGEEELSFPRQSV